MPGSLAAGASAVILVMGAALYFLFNAYTGQVEQRVAAQVAAESMKVAREYEQRIARMSAEFATEKSSLDQSFSAQIERLRNENDALRLRAEQMAQTDPLGFGDRLHRNLARVMCLIGLGEASNDRSARQACLDGAAALESPDISIAITVTAELAERWREECDDGRKDFCDWSITGFTPQGQLTVENYLLSVENYVRGLNADIDLRDKAIDLVMNEE